MSDVTLGQRRYYSEHGTLTIMKYIAAETAPFVPASHENPDQPGVFKRVVATAPEFQRGHIQMLNWARLPGGSSFQKHYHEDMQEVFILLSGKTQMKSESESYELKPGDVVIVEAREQHKMTNLLSTDAEYIVFGISSEQGGQTIVTELS